MFLCGQSNRVWHRLAGRAEGEGVPSPVGLLIAPSYYRKVPLDPWMPFVIDNGAYLAWRDGQPWQVSEWRTMLQYVRMTGLNPMWAAVPDVVADRRATLAKWKVFAPEIRKIGWPTAFCVQDGMTPEDVPDDADVIFIGGSDAWKFPIALPMFGARFPRVHCARVTAPEMFEACEREGCESIDGTGWFKDPSRQDKLPAIIRFIEGHRNQTPQLLAL